MRSNSKIKTLKETGGTKRSEMKAGLLIGVEIPTQRAYKIL